MKTRYSLAGMVIILLLAMGTRLYELDTRSLWADEGWTLVLSSGPSIPDIFETLAYDQHPPLYFVSIHLWRDLTGSSEFALRLLSVWAGLIAVAGIYRMGKSMFNRTSGLLAAFVLALADLHIDLSQDVRHYTPMMMFVVLSCWFYFLMVNSSTIRRSHATGYFITSTALLYTNYLGGYVLVCQVIHMLLFVRPWPKLRWGLFNFGATCAAFLPWFVVFYRQSQVRWDTPLYYLNSLPLNNDTYVMIRDAVIGQQYAITLILAALGLFWIRYRGQNPEFRIKPVLGSVAFLLIWIVGYFALIYWVNADDDRQFLTLRNFLVVTPAVALLIGHGMANLQISIRGFVLVVWLVMSLSTYDTHQLKPPWREVTANITPLHNPGEPILMDIWVGDFPVRYYIEQQMGEDTEWLSIREAEAEYEAQFLPVLYAYLEDREAFWLVYWGDEPIDYEGIFTGLGFQRTASPFEWHEGARLYSHRYDRFATDENATFFFEEDTPRFALRKLRMPEEAIAGQSIEVETWWTAETPPPVDFSLSLFLLDESGQVIAPLDGPLTSGDTMTAAWQPDNIYYTTREYSIPPDLPPGNYQAGIRVYFYLTRDQPLQTACCSTHILKEIIIE